MSLPGKPAQVAKNSKDVKATRIPLSTKYGFTDDSSGALVYSTKSVSSYDANSQVVEIDDLGDTETDEDDLCTRVTYASNAELTAAHIVGLAAETQVVAKKCSSSASLPADLISDDVTTYDDSGRPLRSERIDPTDGIGHVLSSEVTDYDDRGRPLHVTDALGTNRATRTFRSTGACSRP